MAEPMDILLPIETPFDLANGFFGRSDACELDADSIMYHNEVDLSYVNILKFQICPKLLNTVTDY